tara:strand:- start:253 stop:813 length:561 start_codon:yes stop_codon:yes gene_type:complete
MAFKMKYGKGGFPYKSSPMKVKDDHNKRMQIAEDWKSSVDNISKEDKKNMTEQDWNNLKDAVLTKNKSNMLTDYSFSQQGDTSTHQRDKGDKGSLESSEVVEYNPMKIDSGFGSYEYTGNPESVTKGDEKFYYNPEEATQLEKEGMGTKTGEYAEDIDKEEVHLKPGIKTDDYRAKRDPEFDKYEY